MPNRILKESICTSKTIAELAPEEEIFFYRIIVNCDDYGRMDARNPILRAKCFPLLLDQLCEADIEKRLEKLCAVGLIKLYWVDGTRYLQVVTWEKHQQVRAKKSKYPAPESGCENLISNDIKCDQRKSDDSICPRNPIQSNPNPVQKSTLSKEGGTGETKDARSAVTPSADDLVAIYSQRFPERKKYGIGGRIKAHDVFQAAINGTDGDPVKPEDLLFQIAHWPTDMGDPGPWAFVNACRDRPDKKSWAEINVDIEEFLKKEAAQNAANTS